MKRVSKIVSVVIALFVFTTVPSIRADQVKVQNVQIPVGAEMVSGYLATPQHSGRLPALAVIHEWWGLTDWVKEQTRKLADQGYIALAVDLYHGKLASDPKEASDLENALPQDRAVADLQGAFAYLWGRPDVDRDHIGSIGWSMGRGLSVQLAIHQPRLAACVINYGALPTDPNDIQQIFAPVLGNFGADDRGVTPGDVHEFEKTMQAMKRRIDVKIYGCLGCGGRI